MPFLDQERLRQKIDFILHRLLIAFFFCILIIYASRELADLDLWLHLKTGQFIVENRFVPLADIFSFTIAGKPWINHEWLFQVLMYLSTAAAGTDGAIITQNIVLIATFLTLFLHGRRDNNHIFVFIVLYMALLSCAYRFTVRPDIFSLFFLALYLATLSKFARNKSPLIWLLPLCQVFWVNMHGFSFTGPLLVLISLAGELLKRSVKLPYEWNKEGRLDNKQVSQLLIILALLILASVVNPAGVKGAAYPLSVLGQISGKGRIVFQYIQELARPLTLKNALRPDHFLFYKALLVVSLFSFRFNQRRINITDFFTWAFFAFFSFLAIRNIAYFSLAAAFIVFNNVQTAYDNKKTFPSFFQNKTGRVILGYCLLAVLFYFPAKGAAKYLETAVYNFDTYTLKSGMWGITESRFPKKAVDFLLRNKFPKRMFNDFNSGSYLIGRTFPQRQVFIDGRTELYGPKFFSDYVSLGEGRRETIDETIKKYAIEGFFLTTSTDDLHTGLMRYLLKSPRWKIVYFDEYAIIFLKDNADNAALIEKYRIDLKNWMPPQPDILKIGIAFRYPLPNVYRGRFLNKMKLYEAAAREARLIHTLMPNNAEAFRLLADAYYEKKEYMKAYQNARNGLIFAPGDLLMRVKLPLIYHGLGENDKAQKVADAIVTKNPKFAEGFYTKAILLRSKEPRKAIELLRQAVKLAPKVPRFRETLGDTLKMTGDVAGAASEWQEAFEYDSANVALQEKIRAR